MSLTKQERIKQFALIRKEGIFKANMERIKQQESQPGNSQDDVELFRKRTKCKTPVVYCSLCKGFITKSYYPKHRMICSEAQATTVSAQAINPQNLFSPKISANFKAEILGRFHNCEHGNPLIISFGIQEYRKME